MKPEDDDLDRELAIDLELEAEEQRERGLSEREAASAAKRALGNAALIREDVHNMSAWARFDALGQDLRYGIRMLRRAPAFTAISILTLGLGIGACTAIFSIVYAVLLRPLPYQNPERLVLVWTELRARNVPDFPFPIPDVKDYRHETKTLDGIAGFFPPGRITIGDATGGPPEQARSVAATPNLLTVLGVRVAYGRHFIESDGAPAPSPPPTPPGQPQPPQAQRPPSLPIMTILTHEYWQRRFGGDPSIVGKTIPFGNAGRAEVVGILVPGFQLLMPPRTGIDPHVEVITAVRLNFDNAARNQGALRVIARLKEGATLRQAQDEADSVAAVMRERHPTKKNANVHWRVVPMHADVVSGVRTSILTLFAAVVFVLLIACANVANLLAVRAAGRHRELVIRAAIGGTRMRLVRQLLTEALLLAGIGAAVGLALAVIGMRVLLAMAPAKLPLMDSIAINGAVLTFTLVTAVLTALVCGVLPAMRASRPQVSDALRVSQGAAGLRAGRIARNALVIVEVALSFILLIGSGLMLRSFLELRKVDPGFDPSRVLIFTVQPRVNSQESFLAFQKQMEDRLRALPGVEAVSSAGPMPLDGGTQNIPWATEAAGASDPSAFRQANFKNVRPGYFEVMKTPLLAGRTFSNDDIRPHSDKVIVDDQLAAAAFAGRPAVGQWLLVRNLGNPGPNAPLNRRVEIIGVVKHQRHESLAEAGREGIFFPVAGAPKWAVRTANPPESIAPAVRAALTEIDPRMGVSDMHPMSEDVDKSMAPTRFAVVLISIFAMIAVLLAVVGLYGVLSTAVRQRTAEIGVRMAFGATHMNILRLIVGEGLKMSSLGVVAGLAGAFAVTELMRTMLVGVQPTDPVVFASITLLFLFISVIAAWVPARRAARLAPALALRDE